MIDRYHAVELIEALGLTVVTFDETYKHLARWVEAFAPAYHDAPVGVRRAMLAWQLAHWKREPGAGLHHDHHG